MKTPPPTSSCSRLVLTGLIAAAASFALPASSHAQISAFDVTLDGQFTGGLLPGTEWSDVTPFAFISAPNTTAVPTTLGDTAANTLLYAAISHNAISQPGDLQLHLMYDFLPRTTTFQPGETFATVAFPVTLPNRPTGTKQDISVMFIGKNPPGTPQGAGAVTQIGNFFDIFVDLNNDGAPDGLAANIGIFGATTLGPSSLSTTDHLLVELEVSLRIPTGFGSGNPGGLPGGGINPATGLYDPAPVFWGASGAGDGSAAGAGGAVGELQSASVATIQITPSGGLIVTPGPVPEPTSAMLLIAGLGMLSARRRR